MFVKSDIRKVTIALGKAFYHIVCIELGKAGFIHLSRSTARLEPTVTDSWLRSEEDRRKDILTGIEHALSALGIEPGEPVVAAHVPDMTRDKDFVAGINLTLRRIQVMNAKINKELATVRDHVSCLDALRKMGIDQSPVRPSANVGMVFGTLDDVGWPGAVHEKFVVSTSGRYVFGAALAPNLPNMLAILAEHGFMERSLEFTRYSAEELNHRAATLERRLETLGMCIRDLRERSRQTLRELYSAQSGYGEILRALNMSEFSASAMFITGWMDKAETTELFTILRRICGERFIVVVSEQRDPDAPVRLRNSRLLRPFELLVETLGMPANDEIDPTPLTAITFVLMFGLMFGDLGQGLVLALVGVILGRIAKRKGEPRGSLSQVGGILTACGISAAFCGILYGSIFSSERLLSPLWFHPIENIGTLFTLTIMMGVLFIIAGLCVNVVNNLMNSRYTEALFDKKGLAVCILYATVVFFAVRYAYHGQAPRPWEAGVFTGIPIVLFSLRGYLGRAMFHEHGPASVAEYVVETLMDILEIVLSMLANTVSFIRVGAFALSHAGLSIVTYTLAGMADPSLRSPGALIIIVLGNVFIIGFEGLVCGIQSMRLEYYEFFSKFFHGDGVAFAPFVLKAKVLEV